MRPDPTSRISWSERLATAAIAAFATLFTLLAYSLIAAFFIVQGAPLSGFLNVIFSWIGVALVIAAAILGFALGSTRIAAGFSFLWGTHSAWGEVWLQRLALGFLVAVLVGLLIHVMLESHRAA